MGFHVPRVSRRTGIGAVAVAAIGAGVAWGVAPSSAAPQPASTTPTISFTGSGATPSSIVVRYGAKVVFENDVDPSASTPVLGTVSGVIKSVTVTVKGVTQKPFTLAPGQKVTVGPYFSGNQPVVLRYSAGYSSKMVAGLLPGPSSTQNGTLTIAASPIAHQPLPNGATAGNIPAAGH
jgi:hypothetical protein